MKRVALVVIATGKYDQFAQPLYESVCKHLFVNDNDIRLDFILFKSTTDKVIDLSKNREVMVKEIVIEHKPWPYVTLERFKTFLEHDNVLQLYNYIFYVDVDALFIKNISFKQFLLDHVTMVFTRHCGFPNGGWGSPNVDPNSKAYFDYSKAQFDYCMGGFWGGSWIEFYKMCEKLNRNIETDKANGVMAEWHDESHMNHYINHALVNMTIMPPTFFMAEEMESAYETAYILALKKDHASIRS